MQCGGEGREPFERRHTLTAQAELLRRPQQIGEQGRRENVETGSGSEGNSPSGERVRRGGRDAVTKGDADFFSPIGPLVFLIRSSVAGYTAVPFN